MPYTPCDLRPTLKLDACSSRAAFSCLGELDRPKSWNFLVSSRSRYLIPSQIKTKVIPGKGALVCTHTPPNHPFMQGAPTPPSSLSGLLARLLISSRSGHLPCVWRSPNFEDGAATGQGQASVPAAPAGKHWPKDWTVQVHGPSAFRLCS